MIFLQFIHLVSLVVWIGAIIFFSFIAAPAIFKSLPRETAGDVVAKIFPIYHQLGCVCSILALGTLALFSPAVTDWHMARVISLSIMTLITFYSCFVMGPKVRVLKDDLRGSKSSPDFELKSKAFSRIHGISMVLNMLVLLVGIVLLFFTAMAFQPV